MDTILDSVGGGGWFGWFLFFVVIVALVGIGIYLAVCPHAVEKHGEAALLVDQCLNQKGPHLGTWIRKSDGHLALPCEVSSGKWGIKFNRCSGDNCTAMIKEKFKKGWQIIKYLQNTGYEALDDVAKSFQQANPIPGSDLEIWQ